MWIRMNRLHFPLIIPSETVTFLYLWSPHYVLYVSPTHTTNLSRAERVMTLAAFISIVLFTHAYYFNAFRATYKDHLVYYTGRDFNFMLEHFTLHKSKNPVQVNYDSVNFIFFCVWPGKRHPSKHVQTKN